MHNDNSDFGYRVDWRFNPSRDMCSQGKQSERKLDKDCVSSEPAKRAFVKSSKSKDSGFKACELLALLPECPKTNKTVDEIVLEGMSIIELI